MAQLTRSRRELASGLANKIVADIVEEVGLDPIEFDVTAFLCSDCGSPHRVFQTCPTGEAPRRRFRMIGEMRSAEDMFLLDLYAREAGHDSWTSYCRYLANEMTIRELAR